MVKIYATGNENLGEFNVSHYIVEKNIKFLDWLEKLVEEVLNEKRNVKIVEQFLGDDENGIPQYKYYLKDIKKMVDVHEKYIDKSDRNRIDVFYGRERVFLIFRKDKEARKRLAKFLIKNSDWINVKKVDKKVLPNYCGKEVR